MERDTEQARVKGHITSGTHRARHPSETLRAVMPWMSRLGITRLANVTGLDRIGIPVYVAIRPNARSLATSQGKGIDADHARVSALMESIELWHAEHLELPARIESPRALAATSRVIDVDRLPLRAGAQVRPELPLPWVVGVDRLSGAATWVPLELVSMNTGLARSHRLTFFTSSNGLASGNTRDEALLHALLELVERDAADAWLALPADEQAATKIDPATIDDPECRALLERLVRGDQEVAIWDLTSPIHRLPAFMVVIGDRDDAGPWRSLGVYSGYGAHTAPAVALARALAEAAQSRLTIIAGSRDDRTPRAYAAALDGARVAAQRAFHFATPARADFRAHTDRSTPTFPGDLDLVIDGLRRRGVDELVVVDLTRPEIGIPVIKAIAPGLSIGVEGGARAPTRAARGGG